jgi:pimeloyl-ACP methyl ester carboxylesterase
MSLSFEPRGNPEAPLLIAIPGLMGRPDEFAFLSELESEFQIVLPDIHSSTQTRTFIDGEKNLGSFDYDQVAQQLRGILNEHFGGRASYFLGHSSGGKIVFDFMFQYPEQYLGSVNTDISPAPFEQAEFYKLFMKTIPLLDLSLPWPQIRQRVRELIPDRHAQILVNSQIHFPEANGPAVWRDGLGLLDKKLSGQRINDQMPHLDKICRLHGDKKNVVLVAEYFSSIPREVLNTLRESGAFELVDIPGSGHFINISHKNEICEALIRMKEWKTT